MNKEEKKKQFEEHLQQQNKLREVAIGERNLIKQGYKNPQEHMLYIQKEFKTKTDAINQAINQYKAQSITYNQLHQFYIQLKQYYVDMAYALNTYDRQSYKQAIDKIYNNITELKSRLEPRKKFRFSRREEDFGVKRVEQQIIKANNKEEINSNVDGVNNILNQTITIPKSPQNISSYQITDSLNSSITLLQKTQILFLKRLNKCVIKAATTKSTVFVDDCSQCIFELSCHQLRIHNTIDSTFGIWVSSKAIIEDCKGIIFKPYSFNYEDRVKDEEQFQRSGKQNLWKQIQDFNWLKENQKSPNYQLMEN